MREVELYQGLDIAFVDDADYDAVTQWSWHLCKKPSRETGYARTGIWSPEKKSADALFMHQVVAGKAPLKFVTDHINRNGLDNQRDNLRFLPNWLNVALSPFHRGKTSRYRGVYRDEAGGGKKSPWCTAGNWEGKTLKLGYFGTEEEAYAVRLQFDARLTDHAATFPTVAQQYALRAA